MIDEMFETALRLIQAREIGKAITIPASTFSLALPTTIKKFSNPDQRVAVPAGSKRYVVYRYQLTRGAEFGVIRKVANVYWAGDNLYWIVDGQQVEEGPIRRALGTFPNTPTPILIPFQDEILWLADNPSKQTHNYGIFTDGYYAPLKDREALLRLTGQGVI